MKGYLKRLKGNCPRGTYIFWWIIRLAMIGMFIKSLFDKPFSPVISVEILMNMSVMLLTMYGKIPMVNLCQVKEAMIVLLKS